MKIIQLKNPINIEELLKIVDDKQRTLVIVPDKYHTTIYKNILNKSKIIFNLTLLSPNNFLKSVLTDNNLVIDDQISLIKKLQINNRLESEHPYKNNLNFIDELFKLKQELFYSNIEYDNEYVAYLDHKYLNFSNLSLTINYDCIIYCKEDFYPIHQQLLVSLDNASYESIILPLKTNKKYYEHSNTLRMLDYIVKDIYENGYDELLIIIDDSIQQDYLISKLDELNIGYTNLNQHNNLHVSLIKSLFKIINNQANEYDIKNLKSSKLTNEQLINLSKEDYHSYLEKIYHLLVLLEIFELNYLNNLFTKLYLLENTNLGVLNKLLVREFTRKLSNSSTNISNIIIADASFNSLYFNNVIVVDSSLKDFSASKASYLLNTLQRQAISFELISNTYYLNNFHLAQQRLLNCGKNIMFHYALLTLDNKSQDLAYFIKLDYKQTANQDKLVLENEYDDYLHLSIKTKKEDSLLIKNDTKPLTYNNLLEKFNNEIKVSASAMDEFYACPYKYLVSRIYRPNLNNDFSSLTLGNIHHHVIEIINQSLIETKQTFQTYSYDKLLEIINKETYQAIYEDNKTNYDKVSKETVLNKVRANLVNLVDSMIYYEQFTKYKIAASEQELKVNYPNNYFINTYLVGKVDAIMSYNNLSYVLDYKSSENKFSEKDFHIGRKNQLIMYLKLLKENNYLPFGAFFKSINDSFISIDEDKLNDYLENIDELKKLHNTKNPYHGIAFQNYDMTSFDYNLIDNLSEILNIKNTQSFNRTFKENTNNEVFDNYLAILDSNIENMLEQLANGKFIAKPLTKQECNNCDYKVICKYYFNDFNGEEQDDE